MQDALSVVNSLSDSQAVELTKELFKRIYSQVPYKKVKENWESAPEVACLTQLSGDDLKRELPPADSAHLSRLLLEECASDPGLSPVLLQSWDAVRKSDHLMVEAILSLGVIVNLTLLVATTKLNFHKKADGSFEWSLSKDKAKKELVNAIVQPFANLLSPKR